MKNLIILAFLCLVLPVSAQLTETTYDNNHNILSLTTSLEEKTWVINTTTDIIYEHTVDNNGRVISTVTYKIVNFKRTEDVNMFEVTIPTGEWFTMAFITKGNKLVIYNLSDVYYTYAGDINY